MKTATPVKPTVSDTFVTTTPVGALHAWTDRRTSFDFGEVRQARAQHRLAVVATVVAAVSTVVFAVALILVH
jgi:hypothetical protein